MPLLYTEHHVWIFPQPDGTMTAGISNHAQNMLRDIVFVGFPAVGSRLLAGVACGLIESVKTASDLYAPLDGEVVEVNISLQDRPHQLNDTPEHTWIFRFQPQFPAQSGKLMDTDAYLAFLEK